MTTLAPASGASVQRAVTKASANYQNSSWDMVDAAKDRNFSINSVKTYIRTAYRKIGVKTRAQAVAWGYQNGFQSTDDTEL